MQAVPFSIAVLAGGRSRRFGSEKAQAPFAGEPLIRRVVRLLAPLSDDLFVVGPSSGLPADPGLPVHPDVRPGSGPLSGLHAALLAAAHDWLLLVACDMPNPSLALARELASRAGGEMAIVPESGRGPEPLFSLYSKRCLPEVERALDRGCLAMHELVARLPAALLTPSEVLSLTQGTDPFGNVNTPEDLRKLEAELASLPSTARRPAA